MFFRLTLLALLVTVQVAASYAAEDAFILSVRSRAPVVSFDLYATRPDGKLVMPPKPAPRTTQMDENGVRLESINGKLYAHIATISGQASGISNNDLNIHLALRGAPALSSSMKAALDWLEEHTVDLPGRAVVWHYSFEHTFENLVIKPGWPSAFAQADVIKALMMAQRRTGEARYLDLAKRAAYAYTIPCEEGGLRCEVGGVPWFEEVPVPYGYSPMILNGHLYSVVMLNRLWKETGDARVKAAFEEGIASAKRMLLRYDTGYWSIYQMRPRALETLLILDPAGPETELHEISISSNFSRKSFLRFGSKDAEKTFPGNSYGSGAVQKVTETGIILNQPLTVYLQPGPFAVRNDPVHFSGFEVKLRYREPRCAPVIIETHDWRASAALHTAIPASVPQSVGGECIIRALLPNSLTQWSQIDIFYHDWHTRLVTELWRITDDPIFYATAVRWRRYATLQLSASGDYDPCVPVFTVREALQDDAAIMEALERTDPIELSDKKAAALLRAWATGPRANRLSDLMERIGEPLDFKKCTTKRVQPSGNAP